MKVRTHTTIILAEQAVAYRDTQVAGLNQRIDFLRGEIKKVNEFLVTAHADLDDVVAKAAVLQAEADDLWDGAVANRRDSSLPPIDRVQPAAQSSDLSAAGVTKRYCTACGAIIRDTTFYERAALEAGQELPDTRRECPTCTADPVVCVCARDDRPDACPVHGVPRGHDLDSAGSHELPVQATS